MPEGLAIEIYPRNDWFNIIYIFDSGGALCEYYINIALPPVLQPGLLTYVDLDLDIGVNLDFTYTLHDEDEFLAIATCGATGLSYVGAPAPRSAASSHA